MAKYKVGDKVTVECVEIPNLFSIQEIVEITCEAGTQARYSGRLQVVDKASGMIWTNKLIAQNIREYEITGETTYESFFDAHQKIRVKIMQREFEDKHRLTQ